VGEGTRARGSARSPVTGSHDDRHGSSPGVAMTLLQTTDLTVTFGGLHANNAVNISVNPQQFVGLIGPNGAGKTTFIDAITGYVRSTGAITLDGEDLRPLKPHERSRRGLVRTFQSLELFEDLTVEDNLLVAAQPPRWSDWIFDMLHISRVTPEIRARIDNALDLVDLADVRDITPTNLSHGQRKLVGVARALVMDPKLVLLDEPAAGLDSDESQVFGQRIRSLLSTGLSVFMIEHDMGLVLSVCDYIYVLDFGRIIAEGTPSEIRDNPMVIDAYLGESGTEVHAEAEHIRDEEELQNPDEQLVVADQHDLEGQP
jgi:branched-chain amino acid transport system ATP-binding protein